MDTLVFLCLAVALVGLAVLYIYTEGLQPRQVPLSAVDVTYIGAYVRIEGFARSVEVKEKTISIQLCDNDTCASVSIFRSVASFIPVEGQWISAAGSVREYSGHRYIEVKRPEDLVVID